MDNKQTILKLIEGMPWTEVMGAGEVFGYDCFEECLAFLLSDKVPPNELIPWLVERVVRRGGLRDNPKSRRWEARQARKVLSEAGLNW